MRILVIGTGSIGVRHVRVIKNDGHELAICDINKENVQKTAKQFNIAEYYFDYKDALQHRFDAAVICTPNAYHAEAGIFAMSKGCHILMEKPLAHTAEDGARLVAAAHEYGRVLMVGYILRIYPGLGEVKQFINSGQLGKTISARVMLSAENTLAFGKSDYRKSYETGGGIIYDYSHEIDYLRCFFGEPKRLACFKDLRVRNGVSCDDTAEIIMQFESGVLASIHMDYIQECGIYQNRRIIEIICEKGFLRYDFSSLQVLTKENPEFFVEYNPDRDGLFLKQLQNFVAVCDGWDADIVTGEDALKTLCVCRDLYIADNISAAGYYSGKTLQGGY